MKAIIEIELEVAGEYVPETDEEAVIDAILNSLDSIWFIDEDRLDVLSRSATCRLEE